MNIRHIRENSSYSRINQSGIGLLETIIAVGVFSIIALSALRAYLGVMDLFNSSALRTVAGMQTVLAQGDARPERILRRFFSGLVD